jgi:hypothetical protein
MTDLWRIGNEGRAAAAEQEEDLEHGTLVAANVLAHVDDEISYSDDGSSFTDDPSVITT